MKGLASKALVIAKVYFAKAIHRVLLKQTTGVIWREFGELNFLHLSLPSLMPLAFLRHQTRRGGVSGIRLGAEYKQNHEAHNLTKVN